MDKPSLLRLLPRNKDDAVGAAALVKLGYPTVEPVLVQMLDWLRSNGSPVDLVMREFFANLGEPGVAAVRKALNSNHDLLQHTVIEHVVSLWSSGVIAQIVVDLERLATGAGFYGTDLAALRVLCAHRLAKREWLEEWAQFKVQRLRAHLASAEEAAKRLGRESAL